MSCEVINPTAALTDLGRHIACEITTCVALRLSDETLKAVGPFNLVPIPGEVNDPTQGVNV